MELIFGHTHGRMDGRTDGRMADGKTDVEVEIGSHLDGFRIIDYRAKLRGTLISNHPVHACADQLSFYCKMSCAVALAVKRRFVIENEELRGFCKFEMEGYHCKICACHSL